MALSVILLMVLIGTLMFLRARESIGNFGLSFLISRIWDPAKAKFGALPFIYGTLITSFVAILLAGPIGVGVAIFLNEMAAKHLKNTVAFLVGLLAAIPSVVYGLWGIFVLAPLLRNHVEPWLGKHFGFLPIFRGNGTGLDLLAGGLILAVMILPTVAEISREVMATVPVDQREAALALGATKWEMIRMAVLPLAKPGILGAVVLALGRALGETMAVTMVIGNRPDIQASLFSHGQSIAGVLANEFSEATYSLYLSALVEMGLILFGITLVLNVFARLLVWSSARGPKGARWQ